MALENFLWAGKGDGDLQMDGQLYEKKKKKTEICSLLEDCGPPGPEFLVNACFPLL